MTLEIIGLISGFAFKFISNQQKGLQEAFLRSMQKNEASEKSIQNAREFAKLDSGKWIRRIIVLSILSAIVWLPAILPLLNIPVIAEVQTNIKGLFWGLFPDKIIVDFVPLNGFLMSEEVKESLKIIIGFYFGQAVAK